MKTKWDVMLEIALERNIPVEEVGGTGVWMWKEWAQPILQPKLGPWPVPASWKCLDEWLSYNRWKDAQVNRSLASLVKLRPDLKKWINHSKI